MADMPMTRSMLEQKGCESPDCKEDHTVLWLSSQCHPGHPMQANFNKKTGLVTLVCYVCQREAGRIVVGNDPWRPN